MIEWFTWFDTCIQRLEKTLTRFEGRFDREFHFFCASNPSFLEKLCVINKIHHLAPPLDRVCLFRSLRSLEKGLKRVKLITQDGITNTVILSP